MYLLYSAKLEPGCVDQCQCNSTQSCSARIPPISLPSQLAQACTGWQVLEAEEKLKSRLEITDSIYQLTDDEVQIFVQLCGGPTVELHAEVCRGQFEILGLRVAKLFSDSDITELLSSTQNVHGNVRVPVLTARLTSGRRVRGS